MGLSNRDGVAVDPVPFVVIAGIASLLLWSFGPLYGQALGLELSAAVTGSVVLSVVAIVISYYRRVWTARPDIEAELPVGLRAEWLFHLMVILGIVIVGLAIPLVV